MDPKFIISNVLKDLYAARFALAIYLVMLSIRFVFVSNPFPAFVGPNHFLENIGNLGLFFAVSTYVSMFMLMLAVVAGWMESDNLNDDEAFWVTRPAREKHLLTAKIASATLAFVIAPTYFDILTGLIGGAGLDVLWVIPNNIWGYGLILLPVLFVASITPDVARTMIIMVATVGLTALWIVFSWLLMTEGLRLQPSPNWEFTIKLILAIGFAAAFVFQSLFRERRKAVKIAFLGVFFAPLIAIPRLTNHQDVILNEANDLESATLVPAQYVRSSYRNVLGIHRIFRIEDSIPDRVLVPLKTDSVLTSDRGGRQERSTNWRHALWSPAPFLTILENSGYIMANAPTDQADQTFRSALLAFNKDNEMKAFHDGASLTLSSYFSEYQLVSVKELPLERKNKLFANKILSVVSGNRFYNDRIDEGPKIGLRRQLAKVGVVETRFASSFNSVRSDVPEVERIGNTIRVYFLYDPINSLMSVGRPQFDSSGERKFHVDAGSPFFGPNMKRRHKLLTFEMDHDENVAIDRKRLKLIVIDVKKSGNRVLQHAMELGDLSEQISAIRSHQLSSEQNDRREASSAE